MNSPPTFRLRLFGTPCLMDEEGVVVAGRASHRHRLGLLALLALSGGRGLSRDWLVARLWPETDAGHARNLLNVSVYVLRKELAEGAVLSEGDDLRLNPQLVRTDLAEFESALEGKDLERAVGLARAPLLDGFFLSDAPEFERYVDGERQRLAGIVATAMEALAEGAEGRGDLRAAAMWWKSRVALDPFDSGVTLRLVQVLEAGGNRAGALQQVAIHERLLREELDVDPTPEVKALAARLRRDSFVTLESRPATGPDGSPAGSAPLPASPAIKTAGTGPSAIESVTSGAPAITTPAIGPAAIESSLLPRPRISLRYGIVVMGTVAVLFGATLFRSGPSQRTTALPAEASIAVLPLANLGNDPADRVLADAMTEEITALLAEGGGVRVIARTSVASFAGHQLDVRTIGDSLGVAHILEGGVQRLDSRLRLHVRLVDARDGTIRWSHSYEREMQDLFAVLVEVGRAVAGELGVIWEGANPANRARQPTRSIAAYDLYVRGSDRSLLRSDSATREGVEHFRQAIELDPGYAAAWAGLAQLYHRLVYSAASPEREQYWTLAEEAGQNALRLDDSLAEAHATVGLLAMSRFDLASAERHLTRALALDPASAELHEWQVTLSLWKGRHVEALDHAQRALRLDPLSPYAHAELARALIGSGRCDEALLELEKLNAIRPPLLRVAPMLADCYAREKMWQEAIAAIRVQAGSGAPTSLGLLGFLLARAGESEEAFGVLGTLRERQRAGGPAFPVAMVYVGLGDLDQAFAWLDRSIVDRSLDGSPGDPAPLMIVGPLFQDLRRDARFAQLERRLELR